MAKRLVAYAAALALALLVLGGVYDAVFPISPDDMLSGCHTDYYLRVVPVGRLCGDGDTMSQ